MRAQVGGGLVISNYFRNQNYIPKTFFFWLFFLYISHNITHYTCYTPFFERCIEASNNDFHLWLGSTMICRTGFGPYATSMHEGGHVYYIEISTSVGKRSSVYVQ